MVAASNGEMLAAVKKVRRAERALLVKNVEYALTLSDRFALMFAADEKRTELESALTAYKEAREAFKKLTLSR
ncbi:MAG: hypothetical protein Q8Q39_04995 [bacterium]|nr:hypothetical protein [bacterium]